MRKFFLQAVLLLSAVLLTASASASALTPTDIVTQKYAAIKKLVVNKKTRPDLEKSIRAEMDTFVDYTELGRLTLSDEWDKLAPKDRKRFVDGFKKMVQRSYVKKFNPDTAFEVEIGQSEEKDGRVTVKSTIHSGKSEAGVNYAFHQNSGKWMVHDVIIDDVSMVRNYRKQFHTIIGKEGFAGLMAKIDKKNSEAE